MSKDSKDTENSTIDKTRSSDQLSGQPKRKIILEGFEQKSNRSPATLKAPGKSTAAHISSTVKLEGFANRLQEPQSDSAKQANQEHEVSTNQSERPLQATVIERRLSSRPSNELSKDATRTDSQHRVAAPTKAETASAQAKIRAKFYSPDPDPKRAEMRRALKRRIREIASVDTARSTRGPYGK